MKDIIGISQDENIGEIQQKLIEVELWNKILEQKVNNRTMAIRNLLDNVGQGLMTFGNNLLIHKDYSLECSRIFGEPIENKLFPHLIFSDNKEEAEFVDQVLKEVFSCRDKLKTNVYLSMLPEEIKLNNKAINFEYKLIDNIYSSDEKAIMVILTDITEYKLLEDKLKEDEKIIRMVVNVAANYSNFMDCVKEFQYFYGSKVHEILDSDKTVSEMYGDIFRDIHTFKGSFSQFDMYDSVKNLNSMENALSYVGRTINNFTPKDLRAFVYSFDIIDFLDNDMDILKDKLGTQLFSVGETVQVEMLRLTDIEREIMQICTPVEYRTILPMVRSLRFKPLKDLLNTYPKYTVKLGESLETHINVFDIEGEDVFVDSEKYGGFIKSLVHVFRNSVDHGFEALDTSLEQQDNKAWNISCNIGTIDNYTEIVIEDDGSGIDFDKIRNKAIEYGLYNTEQVLSLDEKELLELICRENFSTKDTVTSVSGRGMGLSAVKLEVEKLNGKLEIYTRKGKGTKLRFLIPLLDAEKIEELSAEAFAEPILNTTLDFLQENFQNKLEVAQITSFNANSFGMKNYTAFISIKGLFNGSFAISMDNKISALLLHRILIDYRDKLAESKYTKDMIAECANMILGNSIRSYPNIRELLIIGTPSVIYSTSGDINYEGNMITGYNIETNKGTVVISIIQ